MYKFSGIIILVILAGCAWVREPEYCQIPDKSKNFVLQNIEKAIEHLSDKSVTYELSKLLREQGKLFKNKEGCWMFLAPKPRNSNHVINDGEGAMYVNMVTFEVDKIEWFQY
ncbi:hypothetical protein KFE80_04255 [bacterium SCSIO 12696]|nr:hypothetical protein KFE80_04255 [bacterium SCSIO 12696]